MKRLVKVTNVRLNPFKEEIDNKMKGKFKILGHFGVALFLACALMLAFMPAAPVQAATEVTDVWVEFPGDMSSTYEVTRYAALPNDTDFNKTSAQSNMIVHFTTETELKANIDTITIYFPDGSTALSGSGNSTGTFTITAGSVDTGSHLICVDPDGSGSTYGYHDITTAATLAGYRLKITTPIDIAAGAKPYVYIEENASIVLSSQESSNYKIKVQTSKDTTWALSSKFALGAAAKTPTVYRTAVTDYVTSPSVAGSGSTYTFRFNNVTAITAESTTVTVIFPKGTTVPSSITASEIECQNYSDTIQAPGTGGGYQSCSGDVTVNSDARMVTVTAPVGTLAGDAYAIKFKTGAGITLPQVITEAYESNTQYAFLKYWIYTSADRLMDEGTASDDAETDGCFKISAGGASKLGFNNDAYHGNYGAAKYSDDCAIINGFTDELYVELQDQYGNRLYDGTGYDATVTYSCTAGSVYTGETTDTSTVSEQLAQGIETLYFRATTAGTHTITASSGSYTDGTWEVIVAPAVELYDTNLQLVNTFAATTADTAPTHEGGYYVNQACSAAMTGDTIRLGEGIYDLADSNVEVTKAITIEAVSGTTPVLRKTGKPTGGTPVSITKGATLDGLTFRGLRWNQELTGGFVSFNPADTAGPIIKNCTFENYAAQYALYWIVDASVDSATTSGTITNNTFQNLIGYGANSVVYIETDYKSISGVTISDNTFLNNAAVPINIGVCSADSATYSITDITISGNTISSNRHNSIGIQIDNWDDDATMGSSTLPIKVINNEISGCREAAIRLYTSGEWDAATGETFADAFPGVRIKRNYIHDNAGAGIELSSASTLASTTSTIASAVEIMYNDIVDTAHTSGTYGIYNNLSDKSATAKVTALYNWFGDASGPTVSGNTGGTGDTVSTYMVYSPWLYKSRSYVVDDNVAYDAARMNLVSGWNTLSTPVKLIEAADAVDELISEDDMTIGYYYDATTGWQVIETGYVLSPCDAVYIKMSTTASPLLKFDAGAYSWPSKDLAAGWNLISLAYLDSAGKYEKSAVASVALTAAGLPGYSQVISPSMNAAQTDLFGTSGSSWTYSYGEHATGINTMYAGLGYWVYMQNAATLAGFTITPIVPDLD